MKSTIRKTLALLLAAALILCFAAGCSSEGGSSESQSSASPASESEPESADASEPDEPSDEPSEETPSDSSEEEPSQEPEAPTVEDVIGFWEYNVGSDYLGIVIYENGSAVYKYSDGTDIEARWEITDGVLAIRAAGGRQDLVLEDGRLRDTGNDHMYFKSSSDPDESSENTADFDPVGYWEFNVGSDYLGISLYEDGSALYRYADGTNIGGNWEIIDGILAIYAAGGRQDLVYEDGRLRDTYNDHIYFRSTEPETSETDPDPVIGGFDPVGTWEYNVGSDYLGIVINEDGTGYYKYADGTVIDANWTVENDKLAVFAAGGRQNFSYDEERDMLIDTYNDQAYFRLHGE